MQLEDIYILTFLSVNKNQYFDLCLETDGQPTRSFSETCIHPLIITWLQHFEPNERSRQFSKAI